MNSSKNSRQFHAKAQRREGKVNVFALTTRGLEGVAAAEMAALPGVRVHDIAYRRVTAACSGDLAPLLGLRTVDDVFLDVAMWNGLTRQRAALSRFRQQAARLDLRSAAVLRPLRPQSSVLSPQSFSLTVNFVGKRNYTTDEIKQICAEAIIARHGWTYTPDDEAADLNVRLFIEHETAVVGVRLGMRPLHRRAYKQEHILGSLKPPVAAALLRLAGVRSGMHVLDPCCGAGTILIEAAAMGMLAVGGDVAAEALCAARTNVEAAGAAVLLQRWDARRLPLADASVDVVISNPPWGRAVDVAADLADFYRALCAEIRRVLKPGGKVALLTGVPELVQLPNLRLQTRLEISLFGQQPEILIFSTD